MSKQKKAMPWDELRVCDDDPANVTFEIVFHNENDSYVSEIYGVGKDETVDEAALAVCRRFGWDKERPGDDEDGDHNFDPIRDGWVGKDGRP